MKYYVRYYEKSIEESGVNFSGPYEFDVQVYGLDRTLNLFGEVNVQTNNLDRATILAFSEFEKIIMLSFYDTFIWNAEITSPEKRKIIDDGRCLVSPTTGKLLGEF